MSNPYLDESADDDLLFGRTADGNNIYLTHKIDNTPCSKCDDMIHSLEIQAETPPEVLQQIDTLLDVIPNGLSGIALTVGPTPGIKLRVLDDFYRFVNGSKGIGSTNQLVKAVAEILDEMTGGKVADRYKVCVAEQDVIVAHIITKTVNSLFSGLRGIGLEVEQDVEVKESLSILDMLLAICSDNVATTQNNYIKAMKDSDIEVDQQLHDVGRFSSDHSSSKFDHVLFTMNDTKSEGV